MKFRLRGSPLWSDGAQQCRPRGGGVCSGPRFTFTEPLLRQLRLRCGRLTRLALEHCNIDCKTTNLSHMPPTLTRLSLCGTKCFNLPIDKSFLFKIQDHLPLLETLDVSECEWLEPASLLPLSKHARLRELFMRDCHKLAEFVAYASLSSRYGFRKLKVLDLRGSPVGDSEVAPLAWLPELEQLQLSAIGTPSPRRHAHYADDEVTLREDLAEWEMQEPDYFKESVAGDDRMDVDRDSSAASGDDSDDSDDDSDDDDNMNDNAGRVVKPDPRDIPNEGESSKTGTEPVVRNKRKAENGSGDAGVNGDCKTKRKKNDKKKRETAATKDTEEERYERRRCQTIVIVDRRTYPGEDEEDDDLPMYRYADAYRREQLARQVAEAALARHNEAENAARLNGRAVRGENSEESFNTTIIINDVAESEFESCNLAQNAANETNDEVQPEGANTEANAEGPQNENQAPQNGEEATQNKNQVSQNEKDATQNENHPSENENEVPQNENDAPRNETEALKNEVAAQNVENDKPSTSNANNTNNSPIGERMNGVNEVNQGASTSREGMGVNDLANGGRFIRFRHGQTPVFVEVNPVNERGARGPRKMKISFGPDSNEDPDTTQHLNIEYSLHSVVVNTRNQEQNLNEHNPQPQPQPQPQPPPEPRPVDDRPLVERNPHIMNLIRNNNPHPYEYRAIPVYDNNENPYNANLPVLENNREREPRHRVLYVNVGQPASAIGPLPNIIQAAADRDNRILNLSRSHLDPSALVSDSAVRRFGRASGNDVRFVLVGLPHPYLGPNNDGSVRPERSNLRVLVMNGYRNITDRSLVHLATAAPFLRFLDFRETSVTPQGVENFRSLRPDCEVLFSPYVERKIDSSDDED